MSHDRPDAVGDGLGFIEPPPRFVPGSPAPAPEERLSGNMFTAESLPRIIADTLDAADKRREERAVRQQATQDLEQMRANFTNQLAVLERYPALADLAEETRALLDSIDEKLAAEIATNATMIRESIRQARAAVEGRPALALLPPGAQLIKNHGKRR